MIPHKSHSYFAILDLSFSIQQQDDTQIPSVNKASVKLAPRGATNQLGHSLSWIIHAFASTSKDTKVFILHDKVGHKRWFLVIGL